MRHGQERDYNELVEVPIRRAEAPARGAQGQEAVSTEVEPEYNPSIPAYTLPTTQQKRDAMRNEPEQSEEFPALRGCLNALLWSLLAIVSMACAYSVWRH